VLDQNRASVFFADWSMLGDPSVRSFIAEAGSYGWRLIAMRHDKYGEWDLLVKSESAGAVLRGEPEPLDENIREIADPAAGITLGAGWYSFEVFQGLSFRWASNDGEISVGRPRGEPIILYFIVEPGPGLNRKPLALRIFGGGKLLQITPVLTRQKVEVKIPKGVTDIRLHTDSENKPTPNDNRILNFRVFRIWTK
jgi:hypothetical protein